MSKSVASTFGTFDEKELQYLKSKLREMSDILTMMDSQREVLKELILAVHEELKIPKKIIKKMGVTYHKKNFNEVVAEQEDFELLYEGINS